MSESKVGVHFQINAPCAVGRELRHKSEATPPCPNPGEHIIQYDDDGTGQPLIIRACTEHLRLLAPTGHQVDPSNMCMAGRQLIGMDGFERPCPKEWTETLQVSGHEEGGFIWHLCLEHTMELPVHRLTTQTWEFPYES